MKVTELSPNDYIDSLPGESSNAISKLDKLILKYAPINSRVMWEGRFWGGSNQQIIGYGELSYRRSDGKTVDWFRVGLAQQKNYITIFINVIKDGKYLAESYKGRLGKVKVGKSSISFKSIDDIELKVLSELLESAF